MVTGEVEVDGLGRETTDDCVSDLSLGGGSSELTIFGDAGAGGCIGGVNGTAVS